MHLRIRYTCHGQLCHQDLAVRERARATSGGQKPPSFVSCEQDRGKAYDWSNYRYASAWIHSSKLALSSGDIVDPFLVCNDWLELLLPSLRLVASKNVSVEWKERVNRMLDRLHLGHDERVIRQRREWYRMYQPGQLTLEGLATKAPIIAAAVRKQPRKCRLTGPLGPVLPRSFRSMRSLSR